jgi:CRISPR/Cas system Type II protein with McrA/HNH and RuvC-like nuclease domain
MPDIDTALEKCRASFDEPGCQTHLGSARNILNAISATYGCPDHFSIELTRELAKALPGSQSHSGIPS